MIFGMLNPEKIWHENLTDSMCPPHLSDVATWSKVATSDRGGGQICKGFTSNFLRI